MIDSHCHLDHEPILVNLDKVLKRSKDVGIEKLLTICTNNESFSNILELVEKDPIIYGTYGIHPHEADNHKILSTEIVKKVGLNKKIIGIGETGLDFYYNNSAKNNQINSFVNHIEAAIELDLPLIVHSRKAETETYDVLSKYKSTKLKILMHCFTGSSVFANNLLNLNAYFSASGIITFKNSVDLQNTFKFLPLDRILIETDSPFLTPAPNRGKKNEPAFIDFTAAKLAEIKGIEKSELIKITTNNFNNLFFN